MQFQCTPAAPNDTRAATFIVCFLLSQKYSNFCCSITLYSFSYFHLLQTLKIERPNIILSVFVQERCRKKRENLSRKSCLVIRMLSNEWYLRNFNQQRVQHPAHITFWPSTPLDNKIRNNIKKVPISVQHRSVVSWRVESFKLCIYFFDKKSKIKEITKICWDL